MLAPCLTESVLISVLDKYSEAELKTMAKWNLPFEWNYILGPFVGRAIEPDEITSLVSEIRELVL